MADFDLSRYVNPGNPLPNMDITGAYRQWQQLHLQQRQQQAQEQQFSQNEAQQDRQFSQEQDYKNRVSNDINSRFGLEIGEKTNARGYEQESNRYKQQQALLAKARQAGAEGRWNEVESMLGTLKELGADVGREFDDEGKPIYHLRGGQAPNASGETFQSALSQINGNRGGPQQPYQFNPDQPQLSVPQKSPFETSLGTVGHLAPNIQPNATPDTQERNSFAAQPPTTSEGSGAPSSSFDPFEINSSQLQRMNDIRLKPLMAGIEGAFPNRFQPQINSLLGGMSALGSSPEGYLEHLQKPMDTAARLMGAELNSEGQMARAGMSQSGREDSQSRLLANDGRSAARRVLQEYGIKDAVDNSLNMSRIRDLVLEDNPISNAQGIKELIAMNEGHHITDKDFDLGKTGIASDFSKLLNRLTLIYKDGLSPDQKSNFNQLTAEYLHHNKIKVATGAKAAARYINKFRTDDERYGAWNEMIGLIPDEYIPEEYRGHDPNSSLGGKRSAGSGGSKSISVTAPTPQQAVQGVKDINEEADEFQ